MGRKYECDICGDHFDSGSPIAIKGSGAGRVTRGRVYVVSADSSPAKTARRIAMFGGPDMGPGFARSVCIAMKDSKTIRDVDKKAEDGIAEAEFHERDEVSINGDADPGKEGAAKEADRAGAAGKGGGEGGKEGDAEEDEGQAGARGRGQRKGGRAAADGSVPRRKYSYAFVTTTSKWVRVRLSPTRSRADIAKAHERYRGKWFASDMYSGQEKSEKKQYDCLHIDRGAAACAGAGYDLLLRARLVDKRMLFEYLRAADGWVRDAMDAILSPSPGGDPEAAARRIRPIDIPPATILPPRPGGGEEEGVAGAGAGKEGRKAELSEERAMQCRREILCYLVITRLIHVLKKLDTLPEDAIEALKRLVRNIVEMYGRDHRVRKMILRALPNMFTSLRVPGMPMHTADVENTIRWLFSPFRESRKQVCSVEGMESASLQLTFIGVCKKNGVDPSEAYQRLLDDPEWDITMHPKPPPVRRRRK